MLVEPYELLKEIKTIAVVGASRSPDKDAGRVPRYLKEQGYKIIPINPKASEIAGERAYPSLLDIPEELARQLDAIDVFRPGEEAVRIVEEASKLKEKYGKPRVIWFQYGTSTPEAVEKAKERGFIVVYERCMMEEHSRHIRGSRG
ncbi:MAG: CoA-binding protein [Desulfurococcales archaeon]|nr:CoA-binding protein [Desulfurococcales archaeon]